MFPSLAFLSILPEALLLLLGIVLLIVEPFWQEERRRSLGWVTAGGLVAVMAISGLFGRPASAYTTLGGAVRFDDLSFLFKMLFIFGAGVTALLLAEHEKVGRRGEAYLLLLASTIGMCLMASAADLVMLYLAIETTSIPLYILAGFMLTDARSTEAGFKYLLFGAMASAFMLYGFSLLFGFAGTTDLYALAAAVQSGQGSIPVLLGTLLLIVVGLGFKVSLVPFHFWAPDVYEGAPTPIAAFLSTASKAAGFAVLARLFVIAFQDFTADWTMLLAILSAATMTVGNLLALPQKNIKRLLAYSSIAHAGYAMIGLVAVSPLGMTSVVYYLMAYTLTNLAAFGIPAIVGQATGSDEYDAYRGLSRRSPALALAMLVAFLSLAGMPPFGGFVAKVLVFTAGMQADYAWLVVVGVLNSIVGLYYYLNVMKYVYLYRMEGEQEEQHPLSISPSYALAVVVLVIGVIATGTLFGLWYDVSNVAALALF